MDEPVRVCLETEPPVCVAIPVGIALLGVALFVVWKIIDSGKKTDRPTAEIRNRRSAH